MNKKERFLVFLISFLASYGGIELTADIIRLVKFLLESV